MPMLNAGPPPLCVGQGVSVTIRVTEDHVLAFARITGDFSPNHVDDAYMRQTPYGRRIAHGALIVGYMSQASTKIAALAPADSALFPVSLGYDRIRLLKPVFIDDTITIEYRLANVDADRSRTRATVGVVNHMGETVAVAEHTMKWLPRC